MAMLLILLALVSQSDPNSFYQSMSRPDKERVFLVYEQQIRRRSNVDQSIEATAQATRVPAGSVRLVVLEMRRDEELIKRRRDEAKGLTARAKKSSKDGTTTPKRTSRSSSSSSSSRSSRSTTRSSNRNVTAKKEYSGDGVSKKEGEEKVKWSGKEMTVDEFVRTCRYVRPEKVELGEEKIPIVVDGVVKQATKDWTLLDRTDADGRELMPLLVLHLPSCERFARLNRGDLARLWGWVADDAQIKAVQDSLAEEADESSSEDDEEEEDTKRKEQTLPAGLVFFVADLDKSTRTFPGLALEGQVNDIDASGTSKSEWEIVVEAKNTGDRPLADLEIEANLIVDEEKPKKAVDTMFFYVERLEPGKSQTLKARIPKWLEEEEEEEVEVGLLSRSLDGKVLEP